MTEPRRVWHFWQFWLRVVASLALLCILFGWPEVPDNLLKNGIVVLLMVLVLWSAESLRHRRGSKTAP